MGQNFKFGKFYELQRKSIHFFNPPVGNFRGQNFKVYSGFKKYLGNASYPTQIFWAKPGNPWMEGRTGGRKGEREREAGREGGARAKPGNQLVNFNIMLQKVQN